jgi:hypothetical protein
MSIGTRKSMCDDAEGCISFAGHRGIAWHAEHVNIAEIDALLAPRLARLHKQHQKEISMLP